MLAPSGVAAADNFNPRPPWGGRLKLWRSRSSSVRFQSTPSVGRATKSSAASATLPPDISIHALRGEGDALVAIMILAALPISIHALRGEGDDRYDKKEINKKLNFNPRPPWGGRPRLPWVHYTLYWYFNPRPPWGGRLPSQLVGVYFEELFQSTPSVGRATKFGDLVKANVIDFNPRPPWGGRLQARCRL